MRTYEELKHRLRHYHSGNSSHSFVNPRISAVAALALSPPPLTLHLRASAGSRGLRRRSATSACVSVSNVEQTFLAGCKTRGIEGLLFLFAQRRVSPTCGFSNTFSWFLHENRSAAV